MADPSKAAGIEMAELAASRQRMAFAHSSLTVLLHRSGGRASFSEQEYQRIVAEYGGAAQMNIRFEVIREKGKPDTVVARLERKAPRNAELPS